MENTTFASRGDGWSGNACSSTSSVPELTQAANSAYSLHKIESVDSATPSNPLVHQATFSGANPSQQLLKRSSACISSSPKNQLFLSSYGSAFLSGIFAEIAEVSDEQQPDHDAIPTATTIANDNVSEPSPKKARITVSTSFGRQPKSFMALSGLAEGAVSVVSSPTVVSPRPNTSTLEIQLFNNQVRELQDMAFPSLPQIPIAVSSSTCSTAPQHAISPRDVAMGTHDGPSYGWFVSTDDDVDIDDQNTFSASMFLPDTKPDLAFKAITAPNAPNQDVEVQQALAADTIDDVLGDLF